MTDKDQTEKKKKRIGKYLFFVSSNSNRNKINMLQSKMKLYI